jgi:hypothetical protein
MLFAKYLLSRVLLPNFLDLGLQSTNITMFLRLLDSLDFVSLTGRSKVASWSDTSPCFLVGVSSSVTLVSSLLVA